MSLIKLSTKITDNLKMIIPYRIKVKSMYWVIKEIEIDSDLSMLFSLIDSDEYEKSWILLKKLKTKWNDEFPYRHPEWFSLEYICQFTRAESMLYFLSPPK